MLNVALTWADSTIIVSPLASGSLTHLVLLDKNSAASQPHRYRMTVVVMISVVVIRYRVTNVRVRRTPCTHILLLSLLSLLYNIIASFITIYLTTMGTYLDNPITEKVSEDMEDDTLVCGVSSMQGWRIRQEVMLYIIAQLI